MSKGVSGNLGIAVFRDYYSNKNGDKEELWLVVGDKKSISPKRLDPKNIGLYCPDSSSPQNMYCLNDFGPNRLNLNTQIIPNGGFLELVPVDEINEAISEFCENCCMIGLEGCIGEKCIWGKWKKNHPTENTIIIEGD